MGKETFFTDKGKAVELEVIGRESTRNGHGPEIRIYLEGSHPEIPGSKPHEGLSGEETVIVRYIENFVAEGQLPIE